MAIHRKGARVGLVAFGIGPGNRGPQSGGGFISSGQHRAWTWKPRRRPSRRDLGDSSRIAIHEGGRHPQVRESLLVAIQGELGVLLGGRHFILQSDGGAPVAMGLNGREDQSSEGGDIPPVRMGSGLWGEGRMAEVHGVA